MIGNGNQQPRARIVRLDRIPNGLLIAIGVIAWLPLLGLVAVWESGHWSVSNFLPLAALFTVFGLALTALVIRAGTQRSN